MVVDGEDGPGLKSQSSLQFSWLIVIGAVNLIGVLSDLVAVYAIYIKACAKMIGEQSRVIEHGGVGGPVPTTFGLTFKDFLSFAPQHVHTVSLSCSAVS